MDHSTIIVDQSSERFVPLDGARGDEDRMRAERQARRPTTGRWISDAEMARIIEAARVDGYAEAMRNLSAPGGAPALLREAVTA